MMWNFERFGDRTALLDEHGASLTYRQLKREADALCAAAGGRCLTFNLCRNTLGSLLGYAGFVEGGVVPVLLNEEMDRELLKGLYDNYHPAFLWAPEDFAWDGCEPVYQSLGYHLLKTPFGREAELYPELGLLLTTSGSTGSPKFVRQSYRNIRANTDSIVEYLKLDETERPITTLPMNYTYGVSILNTHLDVGATILVTEHGIAQREFWDFFRRENATSFGGVPYTYEMLDRMRFFRMDLPSLPWEKSLEKVGGIGIAIPGGQFRLIAADGSEITQPGVTGELKYYGDNVTLGYAVCQADLRKGDERGGVLETGDMAQVDADGYYTIVGRKKRFLKLYGNRVNLDELEQLLKAAFPGVDVACGGVDDHLMFFSTDENRLAEMRAFLSEKTKQNAAAFRGMALPSIPKNDAGKTLYRELEKYYD